LAVNTFDAVTTPIDEIVGPTPADSITLITCAGTFDQSTGRYNKRLIVRAKRL
jgi:sortase (surface protein transpeptidase)